MCPDFSGEEEVPRPFLIWSEERDNVFFSCVFKFKRGG